MKIWKSHVLGGFSVTSHFATRLLPLLANVRLSLRHLMQIVRVTSHVTETEQLQIMAIVAYWLEISGTCLCSKCAAFTFDLGIWPMPLALTVCWLRHVQNPSTTTPWHLFISLVAEERIVLHENMEQNPIEIWSIVVQKQPRWPGPLRRSRVDLGRPVTNGDKWILMDSRTLSPYLLLYALGKAWVAYYTKQGKSTKFVWKKHLSRKMGCF